MRKIHESIEAMTQLVDNLLDLGRIEAGVGLNLEAVNIESGMQDVAGAYQAQAANKRITLLADIPGGMRPIEADLTLLRQAVANLVDNAIKYTPEGGQVRVAAHFADESIIITVQDSGVGIPVADQPYIFDKFFRASNTREDQTGTGLGLSIVKSIVENHGGRIWVESHVGQGSIFTVVLPRHVEPPAGNAPAHSVGAGA